MDSPLCRIFNLASLRIEFIERARGKVAMLPIQEDAEGDNENHEGDDDAHVPSRQRGLMTTPDSRSHA